jgi:YVTN family beta-propeller protein
MPIDAAITASGKLYAVNAGSDDVSVINIATRKLLAHIEVGTNPRGIAISPDESLAWVSNALAGTVTLIDTATSAVITTIEATDIPLPPNLLNGKILFHTTQRVTVARDQWISCATCHFEGGADGRTWFFRDGPRNTPALFGVLSTLPMHWSGDLDELQDVEQTIRIVQAGTGLAHLDAVCVPSCDTAPRITGSSRDLDDLAAFMAHLLAPRRMPASSDAIRRGESLFTVNGCVSCHPAPWFTDRRKHDVNTGGPLERKGNAFDTPSLRGLFDTAPYFHDGSAPTLFDVLARHGDTAHLSAEEREDLVAFLLSIPFPEGRLRAVRVWSAAARLPLFERRSRAAAWESGDTVAALQTKTATRSRSVRVIAP